MKLTAHRFSRHIVTLLIGVFLVFASAGHPASAAAKELLHSYRAFSLETPVRIYIEKHPNPASLYKPHYQRFVENSLREWSNALSGKLKHRMVSSSREADIIVRWVKRPANNTYAGMTHPTFGAKRQLNIDVVSERQIDAAVYGTVLHEFGHAFGLIEHSDNPNDVMYPSQQIVLFTPTHGLVNSPGHLSARDVKAIQHLYGKQYDMGEDIYSRLSEANPDEPRQPYLLRTLLEILQAHRELLIKIGIGMLVLAAIPPSRALYYTLNGACLLSCAAGIWFISQRSDLYGFALIAIGTAFFPVAQLSRPGIPGAYFLRAERIFMLFLMVCLGVIFKTIAFAS